MNLNKLKILYKSSPLFIQRLSSKLPKSILIGKEFAKWEDFLTKESIDLGSYSYEKIKETLFYSYENISYYKKTFNKVGFHPNDFDKIEVLQELPTINKDIVKENYEDLVNHNYNKFFEVTTGGSSGDPMKFLQSSNIWAKECAFVYNYFGKFGYNLNVIKATFRGGDFSESDINSCKYWFYNPIQNELHFSPFHISKNTINFYLKKLNFHKPKFFHGYPSAIRSLMNCMIEKSLRLDYELNTIFLISENVSIDDVNDFSSFFNCKVVSFYGHSERLIFAPIKDDSQNILYKPDLRYGYNFVNKNDELVGTSFDNFKMPLINYQTNDFVDIHNGLYSIKGRWDQDFLIGINGEEISLTALNVHSNIFDNVNTFQYYQDKKGKVELLLVVNDNFNKHEGIEIIKALKMKVNNVLEFEIKIVENPLLTERGKFKRIFKNL